ncbi:MAG: ribonuclease H [Proteobacteria bacterium]|nr:ribonuclease H [Pseudomonadota bacterium]MBU4472474.1 ribonuclease H [Pseudomonadota bacterium]MCG2751301.1 ribonuclease H [Desulfobacteraceae bacterium]
MNELILLTDGSVEPRSKVGYGAYLAVSEPGLSLDVLKTRVKLKQFNPTSSTKLELQTVLWALTDIQVLEQKIIVYTDSQNILGLKERRVRFEENDYRGKNKKRLNNFELYQAFFKISDELNCEFVKVRGHQVSNQKNDIDKLFSLVDRASRAALRSHYADNLLKEMEK